jgi:hypothetical protein
MHHAGLPEVLEETARGNTTREFASQQTQRYLLSLLRLEQEFRATVRLQVEEISQLCRGQQQSVERSLRLLQATTQEAMNAPLAGLPLLADRLRALTQEFNRSAMAYREASLVAIGPTGLAGINLIARTAQTLLDDGPDSILNSQLNIQVQQELDRLELSRRQSGQALQAVLEALEDCLVQLLSQFLPQMSDHAEYALNTLLDSADAFEAELRLLERAQDLSHGPTPYGPINRLLNTTDPGELQRVGAQLLIQLDTWSSQLGSAVSCLKDRAYLEELQPAYENFGLLLEDLLAAAEAGDQTEQQRLADQLAPHWEEVLRLQRQLEDSLQSEASRTEPQIQEAPAQQAQQIPESLRNLFLAVDGFTNGRQSLEELQRQLNSFAAGVPQAQQPGIQEIQAGLGYLRQLDHPSQTDLAQLGARLVWEGSRKVRAA